MEHIQPLVDAAYRGPLLFVAVCLLLIFGGLVWWVTFRFWPDHRTEKALDRAHLAELLRQRGVEAADDIKQAREIAGLHHEAIVKRVEGKLDDVHTDVKRIAAKVGITMLLLGLLITSLRISVALFAAVEVESSDRCDPPCPEGQHCTTGGKCKLDKQETANGGGLAGIPHSSQFCSRRSESECAL